MQAIGIAIAYRLQLAERGFRVTDGVVFASGDERVKGVPILGGEVGILFHFDGLADEIVEPLQLAFQRGDLPGCGALRLGQGGGNVFQVGADLGDLQGLLAQPLGHALHFGGVVDRVITILVVPGRIEAVAGLLEGGVGLGGASARVVEGLGERRNLCRAARLEALLIAQGSLPDSAISAGMLM